MPSSCLCQSLESPQRAVTWLAPFTAQWGKPNTWEAVCWAEVTCVLEKSRPWDSGSSPPSPTHCP